MANASICGAMRWAQRLKRVFGTDVQNCAGCDGTMRIIACIEDPALIKAILAHLTGKAYSAHRRWLSKVIHSASSCSTTFSLMP